MFFIVGCGATITQSAEAAATSSHIIDPSTFEFITPESQISHSEYGSYDFGLPGLLFFCFISLH